MSILFNYEQHKKLWILMRDNIRDYMSGRAIPSFADAEMTVDDLKALQFKNENMGKEYKDGTRRAPLFYCYACQYAWDTVRGENELAIKSERCTYCPLDGWNADKCFTGNLSGTSDKGLFYQLVKAVEDGDATLAESLCEQIANLALRSGVETGNDEGGSSGGSDTPSEVTLQTLNAGGVFEINREGALSKMPLTVLVKDGSRYYANPLALSVNYKNGIVSIVNKTDETLQFIIIDTDSAVYTQAEESTLPANTSTSFNRVNNLYKVPVTILVKNTFTGNGEAGAYSDATPYFTIANDENSVTIYNDTDEDLAYIVLDNTKTANRSSMTLPAGTSKTVGSKTAMRSDALVKYLPTVLVKDLTSGSRTYGKFLNSTGIIDVVVTSNTVVYENYSLKSQNCIVLDPV